MKVIFLLLFLFRDFLRRPASHISLGFAALLLGYIFGLVIEQTEQASLSAVIWWAGLLSLMAAPALAMDLYIKEQRTAFFLFLRTSGVSTLKLTSLFFLQRFFWFLILDLQILGMALWLLAIGEPDLWLTGSGLVGLLVMQATYLSACIWVSSHTRTTQAAFGLSLVLLLMGWLFSYAEQFFGQAQNWLAVIFLQLSPFYHFQKFLAGAPALSDLTYGPLVIIGCLYCAGVQSRS